MRLRHTRLSLYWGLAVLAWAAAPVFARQHAAQDPGGFRDGGQATISACDRRATVSTYNGLGINADTLTASKAIIGELWTATLTPQLDRGPGLWAIFLRDSSTQGTVVDLGILLFDNPAGPTELLVEGETLFNSPSAVHLGGGSPSGGPVALVPNRCSLIGQTWCAQAIVFGDLPFDFVFDIDPQLSSAVEGVVGSF